VLDDQPVAEHERRPDVVDDRAAGLREDVVRAPAGAAGPVVAGVLEQLDPQLLRLGREHPPHLARLVAAQVGEDGV
jgi:hypothetical protein